MAAARKGASRIESDIEKYRLECNWEKVLESVKGIKTKTPGLETLGHLAHGEAELELHLLQHPPTHQNVELARTELSNAKHHLQLAAKASNKPSAKTEALTLALALTTHPNVSSYAQHALKTEAQFLLAKLHYATGDYDDALKFLEKAHLEDVVNVKDTSPGRLKMLAESYAIKGMCLECLTKKPTALQKHKKFDKTDKEGDILACYEKAGDLALLYLQKLDKKSAGASANLSGVNSLGGSSHMAGPVLETAVQRAPLLRIQEGKLDEGIDRFRTILKAVEVRTSQTMRTTVARELAEVLLRGVCTHHYTPPQAEGMMTKEERSGSLKSTSSSFSNLRPTASKGSLKPKLYSTESLFIPKSVEEEALLLLLIAELQVNRDVVLSRHKEHAQSRAHTFLNATAVYDLLAITLVRRAQYNMLADTLDRTMKFSYEEFHMWFQFGLSLASAGRYTRALRVLRECSRMEPTNYIVLLEAAKICYDYLQLIDDGIEFSEKAIAIEGSNQAALSRSYLMLGIGYGHKADEVTIHSERQEYQKKCLQALNKAYLIDCQDYRILYHTALHLALSRQIPEALQKVRGALKINGDDLSSLHLLSLLLSAQKQFSEALNVIEVAANQYPDKINTLFTKIKLEEVCLGPEEALVTCKELLNCWKQTYEASLRISDEVSRGTGLIDKVTSDKRSLAQMHLSEYSDRDSVQKSSPKSVKSSVHNSLAASRVEQALSEVGASSTESSIPRQGSHYVWNIQAQIWLTIAELYLMLDKPSEASACVHEASVLFPLSHQIMFMRGCVNEHREEWTDAKHCYDSSLAINPTHIKSLQNLGRVLFNLGNYKLAEKVLRDAVNVDPTAHISWINLGKVLEAQGEYTAASDCLLTGLQLEATSPVLPFSILTTTL